MKECAWCGDDFRGEGLVFDDQNFCSENCRNEYKKDVGADPEPVPDKVAEGNDET